MSYFRPRKGASPVGPETIEVLARLTGLPITAEDISPLVTALGDQLAAFETLEGVDLTDVNPAVEFDPRWQD
jgi:hypothetical protein